VAHGPRKLITLISNYNLCNPFHPDLQSASLCGVEIIFKKERKGNEGAAEIRIERVTEITSLYDSEKWNDFERFHSVWIILLHNTTWYAKKCKTNLISEFWAWKFMKFRKILSKFMKYFQFQQTVFVHDGSFFDETESNSNEIKKISRKSDRMEMIVLCEIGWPQKSPWVRMIWMISCSETIKINSKTWLRFYLIIKSNISFFTIFSFFAFIWFIFENSIKMMPSWHSWIRFTVGLPVTCRFCVTKLPRQPFHWWNRNIGIIPICSRDERKRWERGRRRRRPDVLRSPGSNLHNVSWISSDWVWGYGPNLESEYQDQDRMIDIV